MSSVRLFIARHGETDYNRRGLLQGRGINAPLNSTGRQQAVLLADYLTDYPSEVLVSSNLLRTWQTAEPYQKRTKLELMKNADLDEMDFGDLEGASYQDVSSELQELQDAWKNGNLSQRIPGGESPEDVFERANQAVFSLMKEAGSGTMVLILHGRLIRVLLSEWLGFGLVNMDKIEHHNAGVNHIVYKNGTFEPVYLNKISHLQ